MGTEADSRSCAGGTADLVELVDHIPDGVLVGLYQLRDHRYLFPLGKAGSIIARRSCTESVASRRTACRQGRKGSQRRGSRALVTVKRRTDSTTTSPLLPSRGGHGAGPSQPPGEGAAHCRLRADQAWSKGPFTAWRGMVGGRGGGGEPQSPTRSSGRTGLVQAPETQRPPAGKTSPGALWIGGVGRGRCPVERFPNGTGARVPALYAKCPPFRSVVGRALRLGPGQ